MRCEAATMLWQGEGGPVIAKRVAEDRSASVEAPPVAEHCILVKQAPGGGALSLKCDVCMLLRDLEHGWQCLRKRLRCMSALHVRR